LKDFNLKVKNKVIIKKRMHTHALKITKTTLQNISTSESKKFGKKDISSAAIKITDKILTFIIISRLF
jgi:hypothetical protein